MYLFYRSTGKIAGLQTEYTLFPLYCTSCCCSWQYYLCHLNAPLWEMRYKCVQTGDMKHRPGNRIEGTTGCPSWCRPLRPLFHFLDDVSYPQSVCTWCFWWSRTWVGFALILVIPLPAQFCLGRWVLGRIGCADGQDEGTSRWKSTQPRSATTRHTL